VSYRVQDHVAVVTIDRPEARNALSTDVLRGLSDSLDRAEYDETVRAVVLTGGPQIFASGADIRELRATTPAAYLLSERLAAWQRFGRFPKPAVAAVAGYVLGGGCELAMSCDFIVAADNAVLGQPEIRLGIIPGAGGTQRWARVAGRFRAAELVLGARSVDAWTAQRMGLVNQVVPAECIVEAGVAMAATAAAHSPVAARLGKAALRASEEMPMSAGLEHERSLLGTLLSTEDHLEGIDAFLEKRPARFTGR
jgi:enoyl-CoA hydratase/carnithine racemase